jgi:hypothetical protein
MAMFLATTTQTQSKEETSMKKLLGILMALAWALSVPAAWADGFTQTAEPFARSAEIYAEGYQAFAPSAALPTPQDFVGETVGLRPGAFLWNTPLIVYTLKDPGRFKLELQTTGHEYDAKMHQGL